MFIWSLRYPNCSSLIIPIKFSFNSKNGCYHAVSCCCKDYVIYNSAKNVCSACIRDCWQQCLLLDFICYIMVVSIPWSTTKIIILILYVKGYPDRKVKFPFYQTVLSKFHRYTEQLYFVVTATPQGPSSIPAAKPCCPNYKTRSNCLGLTWTENELPWTCCPFTLTDIYVAFSSVFDKITDLVAAISLWYLGLVFPLQMLFLICWTISLQWDSLTDSASAFISFTASSKIILAYSCRECRFVEQEMQIGSAQFLP